MDIGICSSHFYWHTADQKKKQLEGMAALGVKDIRAALAWQDIEKAQGVYDWSYADRLVNATAGYRLLAILGGTPSFYNGGRSGNFPPLSYEPWRAYVDALARRYKGRVYAYEVLNETNTDAFYYPVSATGYAAMLAVASDAIRRADSAALVVSAGVAGADQAYIKAMLDAGVAGYVDALAFHPYQETLTFWSTDPSTPALFDWSGRPALVNAVNNIAALAGPLPLWITEYGWTTTGFPYAVTEDLQARYITRGMAYLKKLPVAKAYYYCLWDEAGNQPWNREAGYGVQRHDFSRRPAFEALKAVAAV